MAADDAMSVSIMIRNHGNLHIAHLGYREYPFTVAIISCWLGMISMTEPPRPARRINSWFMART